jgi:hypothetical protein
VSRLNRLSEWLLRQPLVWGGLGAMAFYALVVPQAERGSILERTFAGGLWQFKAAACILAFAGIAALGMRLLGLVVQFGALERRVLPAAPSVGQAPAEAAELLAELDAALPTFNATLLAQRLRRALELVIRRDSADQLEADLDRLAAEDRRDMAERSSGVKLLTIAVPLIGVAGAATGVAIALQGLAGKSLDAALPGVLEGVGLALGGLAQAISLALGLLAARVVVGRVEQRLLTAVDAAAARQLMGRFVSYGTANDPHLASVQRMSEKLLATVESAAKRQDDAIASSLASATRRWEDMAGSASTMLHRTLTEALASGLKEHAHAINGGLAKLNENLQTTLVRHAQILGENIDQHTGALADSLEHHTAVIAETEKSLAAEGRRHLTDMEATLGETMLLNATRQEKLIATSESVLKEMQGALVESAGAAVAQQEQLIKQSDVLLKVVDATGQVRKLEEALNSNLLSLAASHNFEQTATSLAAAVQLLSVRLRQPAIIRNEIDLGRDESTSHAA